MSGLGGDLLYVVGVAGMFLILIAPHEAGHFMVAKLFKVRVLEFSIGAGTRLWSMTRGGTLYALRLLPILGYVRMGGMEAGDFEEPNGFHSKPPLQRIAILAAGPIANFIVAMVLITKETAASSSSSSLPGSPAAQAGLRGGDQIRTVDGRTVKAPEDIRQAEIDAGGKAVVIQGVHSGGQPFSVQVQPVCAKNACQVGVLIVPITTPLTAVQQGVSFPFLALRQMVQGFGALFTGQLKGGLLGPDGVTGPIGIAAITIDSVNQGPPFYVQLVALLFIVSWFTRNTDYAPTMANMVWSFAGVLLALFTGWLGGELVAQLGVGVEDGANLDAPSSLHTHHPRQAPQR